MKNDLPLFKKKIILAISGGIAAYKSIELARLLTHDGAEVQTILTQNALSFIQPLPFEILTGKKPITKLLPIEKNSTSGQIPHITLTEKADLVIIAPATANIIGKFAQGIGDDFMSTMLLSVNKSVLIAPAMNPRMWSSKPVQKNIKILDSHGHLIMTPNDGPMASTEEESGIGRMPEPFEILHSAREILGKKQDLKGKKILVTAGPTQEKIDAVRYLSNRSSGKMGYSIAKNAFERGAEVILISGPVSIPSLIGPKTIKVQTATQMQDAIFEIWSKVDVVIMAAAVSDHRPFNPSKEKSKKKNINLSIELEETEDILLKMGKMKKQQILIGFAAETCNLLENAKIKLKHKNLDLIVANEVSGPNDAMGSDESNAVIIDSEEKEYELKRTKKIHLANKILDHLVEFLL
ncbi:MAG: bifunctional phosphopantothenoylcysteine decarboxylase/phosphopantothenate--cysteine ligase CoaBC [Nitrospinota bacterium]|nr:bifunctional phosphopantothenoylcysteine decarboxylase/phosphopantothenate--cysteine ligase CoaBC [Nitrospinota bacterium]